MAETLQERAKELMAEYKGQSQIKIKIALARRLRALGVSKASIYAASTPAGCDAFRLAELLAQTERDQDEITEADIRSAWGVLGMPLLDTVHVAYEHGQWWVVGLDVEDTRRTYSVVEASGPGSAGGLAFEEC